MVNIFEKNVIIILYNLTITTFDNLMIEFDNNNSIVEEYIKIQF